MKTLIQLLNEVNEPNIFYHHTYKEYLDSIKTKGLIPRTSELARWTGERTFLSKSYEGASALSLGDVWDGYRPDSEYEVILKLKFNGITEPDEEWTNFATDGAFRGKVKGNARMRAILWGMKRFKISPHDFVCTPEYISPENILEVLPLWNEQQLIKTYKYMRSEEGFYRVMGFDKEFKDNKWK